jgi:hypothetical protein
MTRREKEVFKGTSLAAGQSTVWHAKSVECGRGEITSESYSYRFPGPRTTALFPSRTFSNFAPNAQSQTFSGIMNGTGNIRRRKEKAWIEWQEYFSS